MLPGGRRVAAYAGSHALGWISLQYRVVTDECVDHVFSGVEIACGLVR